jgi:Protein of unknown function (DUF4446)
VDLALSTSATLVVVALGAAVLAVALAVGAHPRLSRVQRPYRVLWVGGEKDVAAVRHDAFGDMRGRLSFSAAIIDDRGDGLVVSSIHARGESCTCAKGLVEGDSEVTLSPEEQQALAAARTGKGGS